MNIRGSDISGQFYIAEVIVHNILDYAPDLVFRELLFIHKVLDIAERGRLGCGQDVHCRGTLKILEGLGENPDLSRLDHLQGGVQNGSSCSSLGPHSDPVAGIQASLSGFYDIEHHFVLTYLDIKWANL